MKLPYRLTPEALETATEAVVTAADGEPADALARAARSLAYRAGGDLVVGLRAVEDTLVGAAVRNGLAGKTSLDEVFSVVRKQMVFGLFAAELELGDTGPVFWRRPR